MAYILMNKDRAIAKLEINQRKVFISEVLGPVPEFIGNVTDWIDGRVPPIGRYNIMMLLKQAQINGLPEYLDVTKAISMTDTFWVQNTDKPITWDRISPYENRLSRIISEIALNCNYVGGQLRSPSPDYTVDGSVDKCWKRINGNIYLFKTDDECYTSKAGLRPYCEYYSSQVARQLGLHNYVRYGITVHKTDSGFNKPYVYCRAFTSEKFGYVPIDSTKYRHITIVELYKLLNSFGKNTLREMLLLDSIIINFDRHGGNYGFIVNNDTFELVTMAPIFDNDCSLGALMSIKGMTNEQAYQELLKNRKPKTELGGYIKQARMSLTDELISNMKNMYPFHFDRLPRDIDVEDERIKFMEFIVNSQIKAILHG